MPWPRRQSGKLKSRRGRNEEVQAPRQLVTSNQRSGTSNTTETTSAMASVDVCADAVDEKQISVIETLNQLQELDEQDKKIEDTADLSEVYNNLILDQLNGHNASERLSTAPLAATKRSSLHDHDDFMDVSEKASTGSTCFSMSNREGLPSSNEAHSLSALDENVILPSVKSTSLANETNMKSDVVAMSSQKRRKVDPEDGCSNCPSCQVIDVNEDVWNDEAVSNSSFDCSTTGKASSAFVVSASAAADENVILELDDSDDEQVEVSVPPAKSKGQVGIAAFKSVLKNELDCVDLTNDSDDEDAPSSQKIAASIASSLLSEKDQRTLSDLQRIANCRELLDDKDFDPENAKIVSHRHGNKSINIPIFANDCKELRDQVKKSRNFAVLVATARNDEDYPEHYEAVEFMIHYELAEMVAPPHMTSLFRITVVLKCPKHKELANGENIETGDTNDPSFDCASVIATNVIEASFPNTFIVRGNGTIAQYINSRRFCIKDPSPGCCGCLDWQRREEKWCHRLVTLQANYHISIGVANLLICFGGGSALTVVKNLTNKGRLFTAFNDIYGPHLCTLVCHYGYTSIPEQLGSIYKKVQSISLTAHRFFRDIKRKNPGFQTPNQTMLQFLCQSNDTPMVNKATQQNIQIALEADSRRRSTMMTQQWQNPEIREKMKEKLKEQWKNPEYREKMKEKRKEEWKRPEYREKKKYTQKMRDKMSESLKKSYAENEGKAKRLKKNIILSEEHFIKTPAWKTKLKDKVGETEEVLACKYCVCAFDGNKIDRYKSHHKWKEPNNKVYALTWEKWANLSASAHLKTCKFAPDDVKERDFKVVH